MIWDLAGRREREKSNFNKLCQIRIFFLLLNFMGMFLFCKIFVEIFAALTLTSILSTVYCQCTNWITVHCICVADVRPAAASSSSFLSFLNGFSYFSLFPFLGAFILFFSFPLQIVLRSCWYCCRCRSVCLLLLFASCYGTLSLFELFV